MTLHFLLSLTLLPLLFIFLCSWSVFCLSVLMFMLSYYFQKLNFEHSHCIPNFLRKSRNTTTIILMKTQTNKSINHLHDSERQRDIYAHVKEWHDCACLFFLLWYPPAFIPSYVTAYFPSLSRLGKKHIFKGTWYWRMQLGTYTSRWNPIKFSWMHKHLWKSALECFTKRVEVSW